jgi:hypothetical protein
MMSLLSFNHSSHFLLLSSIAVCLHVRRPDVDSTLSTVHSQRRARYHDLDMNAPQLLAKMTQIRLRLSSDFNHRKLRRLQEELAT